MDPEELERYRIDVMVEGEWPVDVETLRRAVLATLLLGGAPPSEVAVVVSDDASLQDLNRRFRSIDAPTDVLAFPNETRGPFISLPDQPHYLGDVIISYPRAEEQAGEAGHDTLAELQLLTVHGVLHLLGYDDEEDAARADMWAAQGAVLRVLGVQMNM